MQSNGNVMQEGSEALPATQSIVFIPQSEAHPELVVLKTPKGAAKFYSHYILQNKFTSFRGVSYVTSLRIVDELFENGYENLQIVVGKDFSESYKKELSIQDKNVVARLVERIETGSLELRFPARGKDDHGKVLILSRPGLHRVIFGSANLTDPAMRGKQVEWTLIYDFHQESNPLLRSFIKEYDEAVNRSEPFMGDLIDRLREHPELPRENVVEEWIKAESADQSLQQFATTMKELSQQSLNANITQNTIIDISLPESKKARSEVEKFVKELKPATIGGHISLNGLEYGHYVRKVCSIPLMCVDPERKEIRCNLERNVELLTEPLPEPMVINEALQNIEDFINTVDLGITTNPELVKASMFEALLYVFFAPFANEHMRAIRHRHGRVTPRGPRFLLITGESSNGKSTFLMYVLKLLTGHSIKPLARQDFAKITTIMKVSTVFPAVFDDMTAPRIFERTIKGWWETEWDENNIFPTIIMSSNPRSLTKASEEWAKSRIKKIVFDVKFEDNKENKDRLSAILSHDNRIFRWFSHLYMEQWSNDLLVDKDELHLARMVMTKLYKRAGRSLPSFFPQQPLERIFNEGQIEWVRLFRHRKASLSENDEEVIVTFTEDMTYPEIQMYEGYIPQTVKHQKSGKTLVFQNPEGFFSWLPRDDTRTPPTSVKKTKFAWFRNLFGKSKGP